MDLAGKRAAFEGAPPAPATSPIPGAGTADLHAPGRHHAEAEALVAQATSQRDDFLAAARAAADRAGGLLPAGIEQAAVKGAQGTAEKLAAAREITDALRTTVLGDDPLVAGERVSQQMRARADQ